MTTTPKPKANPGAAGAGGLAGLQALLAGGGGRGGGAAGGALAGLGGAGGLASLAAGAGGAGGGLGALLQNPQILAALKTRLAGGASGGVQGANKKWTPYFTNLPSFRPFLTAFSSIFTVTVCSHMTQNSLLMTCSVKNFKNCLEKQSRME